MELLFWQGLSVFFYLFGLVVTNRYLYFVAFKNRHDVSPQIVVFMALIWPLTWSIIAYQTIQLVKKSREVRHAKFFA